MATYYVDYINGNDANAGTVDSAPIKHDPDMANSTWAGTLADSDTVVYLGDTGSSVEWLLPSGCGVDVGSNGAFDGITRKTRAGDFPVIFDFRVYLQEADWTDPASYGGEPGVWRCETELSTSASGKRFFINDVAANIDAADDGETRLDVIQRLTHNRPVYMSASTTTQNSIYFYTGDSSASGNPSTIYGDDNLSFVRVSGAINLFYFQSTNPCDDHILQDIIIRGAATGVSIQGYHNNILIDNVRSEMWGRHGFNSTAYIPFADLSGEQLPYVGVPNRYIWFDGCVADMTTQIDEWPNSLGERGGDSFLINGAHIGGRIINCHSQDQHHTAFSIQGHNTYANDGVTDTTRGYTHGAIGCEIGWCTADNRNSFYGRLIGSVGSPVDGTYSYNNAYGIIHHNSGTNMKTRSQISGDNMKVYNNNFSNVIGTRTQYGGDYEGQRLSGEGLVMATSEDDDGDGFGTKTLSNCQVFNNTFSNNRAPGLRVHYAYASSFFGNNVFRDNIFLNNAAEAMDAQESSDWRYKQLIYSADGGVGFPGDDSFEDNHLYSAGSTDVFSDVQAGTTGFTVAEFNVEAYASNNNATVTKIDRDGVPRTGANNQAFGTLPAVITVVSEIPAGQNNDLTDNATDPASRWMRFGGHPNVFTDKYGVEITANGVALHTTPVDGGNGAAAEDLTLSMLIGGRPEWENLDYPGTATAAVLTRINDGVSAVDNLAQNLPFNTMTFIEHTFTTATTATQNWGYIQENVDNVIPNFHMNISYVRLAYESTAPLPLDDQYTQWDLTTTWGSEAPRAGYDPDDQTSLGDDNSSNDYIGAFYTISAPVVPDIVDRIPEGEDDTQGAYYTETQASARLAEYFFTDGTVTYAYSSTVPLDSVISQGTAPGTTGTIDDGVDYVVSLGAPPVPGLARSRARGVLFGGRQGQR